MKKVAAWVIVAVLAVLWWFYGVDYLARPRTFRIDYSYLVCVVLALSVHLRALWQYQGMARLARTTNDRATMLYAYNQRVRYIVRALESCWVMGLGVLGILSVHHPSIVRNPNYERYVLTYFFGTVLITGYLTVRDIHVVAQMKKLGAGV